VLAIQLAGLVSQLDQIKSAQLWKCHDLRAEHCAAIDAHLVQATFAVQQARAWCKVVADRKAADSKAAVAVPPDNGAA
jgi:hypothetical protein